MGSHAHWSNQYSKSSNADYLLTRVHYPVQVGTSLILHRIISIESGAAIVLRSLVGVLEASSHYLNANSESIVVQAGEEVLMKQDLQRGRFRVFKLSYPLQQLLTPRPRDNWPRGQVLCSRIPLQITQGGNDHRERFSSPPAHPAPRPLN